MGCRHTRMYGDFLIDIELLRMGDDSASLVVTTRSLTDGSAGPPDQFSLRADHEILSIATDRIKRTIDAWQVRRGGNHRVEQAADQA